MCEKNMEVKIEQSWKNALREEFGKEYFSTLTAFVKDEYAKGSVYPAPKNIFAAFDLCPFDSVNVVILGQDPYHGAGQATGLSFAVTTGTRIPPSLQNIYKEIQSDLQIQPHLYNGDLRRWATQGVLLLNSTLTVRAGDAGSHQKKGWEEFTDVVIQTISNQREHVVFILWGNYARAKGARIDRSKHLVIESAHPSPFSAANGFFDSKPFSKTNEYLESTGKNSIEWK
jgi:uracil-DNA glycosylase